MSYIGEVRRTAFSSVGAMASAMLVGAITRLFQIGKALKRRALINQLGEFDDYMLRDIGLTRSDLRDAAAGPLWQDPTSVLVVRAVERRAGHRQAVRETLEATREAVRPHPAREITRCP